MPNKKDSSKRLVTECPFCGSELCISRLSCEGCDTRIDSRLPMPAFFRLPDDLQAFVMVFLRCRGNIREVEKALGISYPTVSKRLDLVNQLLGVPGSTMNRNEVLEQLERGEISVQEATQLLKEK